MDPQAVEHADRLDDAGQHQVPEDLVPARAGGGPLPITSSRMGHLRDALAYAVLGLEQAVGGDEVFRDLVLARIIDPRADSVKAPRDLLPAALRRLWLAVHASSMPAPDGSARKG